MSTRAARPLHRHELSYRRLVVPIVSGPESEAAMALAAELAAEHGATIWAVVVIELPPQLPLEAHMLEEEVEARHVLEEARAIAAVRGVRVHGRTLRAREAGEAIVAEAERAGADLVVLRAPRKRRTSRRARIFGKTVDHVLKHASCRVLLAAPPPHA
jgi:APA family basic amino acid/polyamine antiporter